eukprot:TRINITY_DN21866_c0_g1_i1.p1 TRINITY_DN21866_c0_g1~~TRINITY_DN21866_c0_g1_i1.p1  ORF type:complete len:400 (+),score=48.00 TRINITY_DN21866_c0_g1_i1:68-1267(+)
MGCALSLSRRNRRSFHSEYALGSALGCGAFGQVRLAFKKDTLDEVAVKITALGSDGDRIRVQACTNEAALASRMGNHPNCVNMFDHLQENDLYYMIMERCNFSLMDVMNNDVSFINDDLQRVFCEMLTGISHCHFLRVVHRDVKPDNFMFGGPEGTTLKLGDFGLARALPEGGFMTGACGTAPYMAPEMIQEEPYNEMVDVWSFGVVAYIVFFGCFPYNPRVKRNSAMKAAISVGIPEPFFTGDDRGHFARTLLERSKEQRCSACDALKLAFLQPSTSSQPAVIPELEFTAYESSAHDEDAWAGIQRDTQRRLTKKLEDLQEKHGRNMSKMSASSSTPRFFNLHGRVSSKCSAQSAAPELLTRFQADDLVEQSCVRSCVRPKTHTGLLYAVPDVCDLKV